MLSALSYVHHVEKHPDLLDSHDQSALRPDVLIVSAQDDEATARLAQETRIHYVHSLLLLHGLHAEDPAWRHIPFHTRLTIGSLTTDKLHQALSRLYQGDPQSPAPGPSPSDHSRSGRIPSFTPREQEALSLLAAGMSNREIADYMGISEHGAKRHVGRLLAKLNCSNRTLAVTSALRLGLLTEMFLPLT